MYKTLFASALKLAAAATFAFYAPFASAGADVSWSVTIGTPYSGAHVYTPPTVIYTQPQPVYIRPQPVYVQPATVVHYGQPYYVEAPRRKHRHWKHHHRHHQPHHYHGHRYGY